MIDERTQIYELNTGRTRPITDAKPLLSSAPAGWDGFLVEEHQSRDLELKEVCGLSHVVVVQLDAPLVLEWKSDGTTVTKTIAPGQVSIVPANVPFSGRFRTSGRVVTVSLDQKFLSCAAAELDNLESCEPLCVHGVEDSFARELVMSLRAEAQKKCPEGRPYAAMLAATLAAHVIHCYSAPRALLRDRIGGLTRPLLRRVIEFIHDRLAEDLPLSRLAAVTEFSPFHFARLFKLSTDFSPHEYVIRCRVDRAKELLLRSPKNITEVALAVGFCDQSHLARHFRRIVGLAPAEYVRTVVGRKQLGG